MPKTKTTTFKAAYLRANSKYETNKSYHQGAELPKTPDLQMMAVIPPKSRYGSGTLEGVTFLGIVAPPSIGQRVRLVRNSDPKPRDVYTATVADGNPKRIVLQDVEKTNETA